MVVGWAGRFAVIVVVGAAVAVAPTSRATNACTVVGTAGDDVLVGTGGDDVICGRGGNDVLRSGAGDDVLVGGDGDDRLVGEEGADILQSDAGDDLADGGPGDDAIGGGSGDDRLAGGDGDDVVLGKRGDDRLDGGAGADDLSGARGDDLLQGRAGNDRLDGGNGRDDVRGGEGDDALRGGEGDDALRGKEGSDHIMGEEGNDRAKAGPGRLDVVEGGPGADTLGVRDEAPFDVLLGGDGLDLCVIDPSDHRRGCKRPLDRAHGRSVPILTYHVINDPPPGTPFPHLWVSPRAFAGQMAWLHGHGWHAVSLQDVWDYWHGGRLPRRAVVVSFDDGYLSQLTVALPILRRYGFTAVENFTLAHLNRSGLTQGSLRVFVNADWELDSHTLTHPDLTAIAPTALRREVAGSRATLRRLFDVPVRFFCYPFGRFDDRVVAAVRAAGYDGATTTLAGRAGPAQSPYALHRIQIVRGDGVAGLVRKLRGLATAPPLPDADLLRPGLRPAG